MASNWAIVIGINQYRFLQPLRYAKRDAEAMHSFLMQEARFDRIFLFTDDSPAIGGKPTEPFRANLLRVLRQIFASPFMKDGDNFWFFFSGHGIPHNGQDYLMPLDGDPEDIENTGISTNTITNYLRSCGADNAVMILDACRSGRKKSGEGIGRQTEAEARQTGVISLFSCSPDQYSYELEAIGQGAFTYALLEGLGIRGRCATVERLNQYLEHRVPELVSQHLQRARQIPYTIAEPLNRSHLILMPQHASLTDIATLKNDAYRAERKEDWDLAQRLWIRVLAAASGSDMEAIEALQNLGIQRRTKTDLPQPELHLEDATAQNVSSQPTPDKSTIDDVQSRAIQRQHEIEMLQQHLELKRIEADFIKARQEYEFESQLIDAGLQGYMNAMQGRQSPLKRYKNDLSSERFGANYYAKLRDLLKAQDWKAADQETADRMCEVMDRQKEGWLGVEDIQKFPCKDLRAIDQLWVKYSQGKFGFSVQKRIWQQQGNSTGSNANWEKFGKVIGWTRQGLLSTMIWKMWDELTFDISAPIGHLPACDGWWDMGDTWDDWVALLSRAETCKL